MLGDPGGKGCVFLGVWDSTGGQRRSVRVCVCVCVRGCQTQGQGEHLTLRVRAGGWGVFSRSKHLKRKQTKAWNEREAAHAWKMGQRREGAPRDLSRHIN